MQLGPVTADNQIRLRYGQSHEQIVRHTAAQSYGAVLHALKQLFLQG